MTNKRIVVVLGQKAFGTLFHDQQEAVKQAAAAITDLVEEKYEIVITHSNAPQIGMIHTAMAEFSRLDPHYSAAMSICSAMSQGYIGYDLQNAIRTELINRGIYKPVTTLITQVRVDPFDEAFSKPTKIIGRIMTKKEAEEEESKGNSIVKVKGGYHHILPSPKPIEIYEIDAIKALLLAGQLVIAGGGGGIPVLQQDSHLKGASAIIEKDYTGAKMAEQINADILLFLTGVEKVYLNFNKDNQQPVNHMTVEQANSYIKEGHFSPNYMLPKVEAAAQFAAIHPDKKAIITSFDKTRSALKGKTGTTIQNQ